MAESRGRYLLSSSPLEGLIYIMPESQLNINKLKIKTMSSTNRGYDKNETITKII